VQPPIELPPGRAVDLPGRGTTFVRELAGPPGAPTLLLLHGLTATADLNWVMSYRALGERFHVVAMDQRGHGRGVRVRGRFRLADAADDAAALIDVLGTGPVIAVGYSMGGPVAQLLWRRHRDHVAGLVLCATSRDFGGDPRTRYAIPALVGLAAAARMTPAALRGRAVSRFLPVRFDDPPARQWAVEELRNNDPANLLGAAAALLAFSSRQWIGDVDVPTAVVVTTRDHLVPPHRQRKLAAAIPGATVHEVAADHDAAAYGRFVAVLVDACGQVAARRRSAAHT
jgi:pimeloyl-ACP methyl ester carboxylesterase